LRDPSIIERLKIVGAETVGMTPREMAAYIASQLRKWTPLVKASGVVVNKMRNSVTAAQCRRAIRWAFAQLHYLHLAGLRG
jgi:hypothetical protein